MELVPSIVFFFFNDTATTEIYTLSLHDALPISPPPSTTEQNEQARAYKDSSAEMDRQAELSGMSTDRKSTRLNSSHLVISYAVFCLKKKKPQHKQHYYRHEHKPLQYRYTEKSTT